MREFQPGEIVKFRGYPKGDVRAFAVRKTSDAWAALDEAETESYSDEEIRDDIERGDAWRVGNVTDTEEERT